MKERKLRASDIAQALNAKASGAGWTAKCPAHNDKIPSFSIGEGSNGRILVHCHSGCSQQAVIEKLKNLGLWPSRTGNL